MPPAPERDEKKPKRTRRPPPPPPPPVHPGGWARTRRGLLWFAPEFLVVVSGVLVALALNAWWQGRQARENERAYLRQLLADTRENEERLDDAIAQDSTAARALTLAMDAVTGTAPPPPPDSLLGWILEAGRASDFQPLAGTYDALIGTGDLRLVRNDSLRTHLTAYAASLDSEVERLHQLRGAILDAVGPLARALPFLRRIFLDDPTVEDVDVGRLRADPEVAVSLLMLQASNANRLAGLRRLRGETHRLRRALEAEPAAHGP